MKLYVNMWSPNCRKVAMTAYEAGIEPELVTVDLMKGAQRKPEFLAMNPNGKVPVMDDDGFILWESNAIAKYIAWTNRQSGLWPDTLQEKADVERWMSWQLAHLNPAMQILTFEHMLKAMMGKGDPDPVRVEEGLKQAHTLLGILNEQLEGRDWLVGKQLTVADISLSIVLCYAEPAKIPVNDYPNVQNWLEQISTRDSWKRAVPK